MIKCNECHREHIEYSSVRPVYTYPVYWDMPYDGALFKCSDCNDDMFHKDVYLTQIKCGHRLVICKECIDKWWLDNAKYLGMFKD